MRSLFVNVLMRRLSANVRPRFSHIAAAIAFIASSAAAGITGVALPVDAGIGATWDNFRDPPWIRASRIDKPALEEETHEGRIPE